MHNVRQIRIKAVPFPDSEPDCEKKNWRTTTMNAANRKQGLETSSSTKWLCTENNSSHSSSPGLTLHFPLSFSLNLFFSFNRVFVLFLPKHYNVFSTIRVDTFVMYVYRKDLRKPRRNETNDIFLESSKKPMKSMFSFFSFCKSNHF